jgi:molybdopterin/thiamine biosynthesis adenylyltransferase
MKIVTVVGVGALGSHVAQFMRNVARLRLVDFDRLEFKNTLSQFHGKPGIGKTKLVALDQVMNLLWGIRPLSKSVKLSDLNADTLLNESDLVIDCTDNAEARLCIQAWARRTDTPCLHGALAADGALGIVIWDKHFIPDKGVEGAVTCEGGEHLPFIAMVSGYIARVAQIFLVSGKQLGFQVLPLGASVRIS